MCLCVCQDFQISNVCISQNEVMHTWYWWCCWYCCPGVPEEISTGLPIRRGSIQRNKQPSDNPRTDTMRESNNVVVSSCEEPEDYQISGSTYRENNMVVCQTFLSTHIKRDGSDNYRFYKISKKVMPSSLFLWAKMQFLLEKSVLLRTILILCGKVPT